MATNPYTALGVDTKSSQDEIKSAYRNLAKKFHPDLNPGNKKAESQFKEINSAYEQIGTVEERAKYDRGQAEAEEAKQYAGNSRGPFYSQTQQGGGRYTSQFEGIDEDILNSIFSQMGRQRTGGFQGPAEDELYQMEIDFKDSILGGEREIALPSGKKFRVKIPSGVESGTKLRFAGKGEPSAPGAPPGDVYVQLNVKPSLTFKRLGKDLEVEISVPFSDAILGGEVKVPTIDGSILMNIPPNVSSGQKLRVKGKGVLDPATNSRGDQIAILKIKMPENVDAEFRKAVEDWRNRQAKESV